ncbi:DUF6519 domain-containing protein [Variovorax sp. OV329]|uniref:DUF6519 domain-containing protein n=1 Tax=Variovorax sp. OV329 TaxID=1882825 RepID=UPI0008E9C4F7|nr:DUF6519 domain-containing protein [Variovorax sp. OV329]SFL96722.1 Uncharacterized protein SAMN05444747_101502 [Variovorax sp. OV329]
MKADLSRETFEPGAHYTAVRMQQGRVITDADFNEEGDITRHRAQTLAGDVIGASGAPADSAGFALSAGMGALAVHAADANSVWVAGEDGVLLVSTNGGAAWTVATTGTTRHLRAIARAANTGWAVGDGGTVLRTSNAGSTWTVQDAGGLQLLRGVAVFDAQRAWAVGDGGLVLRTVDGGATWTQHASGVDRLYAVAFASAQDGLAVGPGGAIVRTADGGAAWTRVDSGSSATLRAVSLAGAQAWAVGDGGTALRSNDGGATWTAAASGSTARLRAVRFRDASNGWIAGDNGTLLTTINGGNAWSAQPVAGSPALAGLSVAGAEAPWLVGGRRAWRVAATGAGAPAALPAASLGIGAGRYYVQGQLCEWEEAASLANQPDGGVPARLPPGTHLVYLRAWQRHISALEAPAIREVALGGPDTATRARQVAQVRTLALPAAPDNAAWHCGADVAAWNALTAASTARIAARAEPELAATGVCEMAATAGYRRLENQLYRVEIHAVDSTGAASFKWSRENGSVVYAVEAVSIDTAANRTTVRLAARGRDANLDLALHDRVELVDDEAELQGRAGQLFEYLNDGDDALELVLAGVPAGTLGQDPARHPVLRRWDHTPAAAGENALAVEEGDWITLEDGVQIRFAPGGSYRPGDYWQIPARTVTADVEWPRDGDGQPADEPPAGVQDAWARLGLVTVDANGLVSAIVDCRDLFPPLTRMTQLLYVGGDGQDTTPGGALPEPLRVRVMRGALPVPGARVRFAVEAGGGAVGNPPANGFDATCNAQGLAECPWRLGTPQNQRVRANLLTTGGAAVPEQVLVFAATASTPASGGGGCEITIGEGGNFPELSSELLEKLLAERPSLCICFLPGTHQLKTGLQLDATPTRLVRRLSLHGCGPTAVIQSALPISLSGLAALELRDLQLQLTERGLIALTNNTQVEIDGVNVAGRSDSQLPWLAVGSTRTLRMHGCTLPAALRAAAVFQDITAVCEITHCVFAGDVAFYGIPDPDVPRDALIRALQPGDFEVQPGAGQLVFANNLLTRMSLGIETVKLFTARQVRGLFQTVVLQGNTFTADMVMCAGNFMSVSGNHFTAAQPRFSTYGMLVGRRAAASSNIGELVGDNATLWFLVTKGEFRGAANMVFTIPQSLT